MRNWLNNIEKDLGTDNACTQAGALLDLGEAFTKLNYTVGMINSMRLRELDDTPQHTNDGSEDIH